MEIKLIVVGKTKRTELSKLIDEYIKRINFYCRFKIIEINSVKSKKISEEEIKKVEGDNILKNLNKNDTLILLDERGKSYGSRKFSEFISSKTQTNKNLTFVIGGAFGFSNSIYKKSNDLVSLSSMTFSHQIIRLFFTEQLYRAFTIINNHPYHND
ncbi:MAG: 23S rRNA (pseudouridine(1915)-N(3))-methyltransferase RlmH [Flavobacteriaceae bacterium]|nr:23S rRNA (pseudouridine(1915)-N(3))-methyltransferase RlmH [Flavobacteriaceae bacterium]